jgi:hypothetical protein
LPNIFSSDKLNPDFINNTFNGFGNFQILEPITIPKMEYTEILYRNDSDNLYIKLIDSVQQDRLSIIALKEYGSSPKLVELYF